MTAVRCKMRQTGRAPAPAIRDPAVRRWIRECEAGSSRDFEASPMSFNSVMVSSPPRCSRNSSRPFNTDSSLRAPSAAILANRSKPRFSRSAEFARRFLRQETPPPRIDHVQRDADRDRFAMRDLKVETFELVRGPVPEIQRARRAEFEGIAAGARCDSDAARRSDRSGRCIALGIEVAQGWPRPLDRLRRNSRSRMQATFTASTIAGPLVARRKRRPANSKSLMTAKGGANVPDKILFPERVDAVLHADAGIVLARASSSGCARAGRRDARWPPPGPPNRATRRRRRQ